MQPRTDLAAAASLPLAGCTQLEAISSDREKAGHRWQRRHRTRPVRRRHPADLPRVVRRRGAARRSRRPRGPLRARRGVRSDRGRRRRRRPRRGALAGGPPRQLADAVRRRLRRRLRPRHVRGALLPGHAHVPPRDPPRAGGDRSAGASGRPRGDPAGRLHLRRAAGRRHGGQYAGGKLTNRVPPARGLAAIFAVLAVLALAFVPVTTMDAGLGVTVALCGVLGFFLFAIQPFYRRSRPSASGLDPEAVHQNAAGDLHAPGRPRALLRLHVPRQVRNRLAEHRRRWGRPR